MYEFVCEHLIPGCPERIRGENQEEVLDKAMDHMRVHHDHEGSREDWGARVITDAMIYLPR